jgi:hypothetical protein
MCAPDQCLRRAIEVAVPWFEQDNGVTRFRKAMNGWPLRRVLSRRPPATVALLSRATSQRLGDRLLARLVAHDFAHSYLVEIAAQLVSLGAAFAAGRGWPLTAFLRNSAAGRSVTAAHGPFDGRIDRYLFDAFGAACRRLCNARSRIRRYGSAEQRQQRDSANEPTCVRSQHAPMLEVIEVEVETAAAGRTASSATEVSRTAERNISAQSFIFSVLY